MSVSTVAAVPSYLAFDAVVTGVHRLSPSFVRVTFGGDDLDALDDGGPLGPRDTRVKLVVPDGGREPSVRIDAHDPTWYRTWRTHPAAVRGHLRTYTARAVRRSPGEPRVELDVDFALHLDADGRGGPATVWAANARPGDRLNLLGPNRHAAARAGFEWRPPRPVQGQRVLLAGDETALPAIASILSRLPEQNVGDALVEVPSAADAQQLIAPSGVRVAFLPRDDVHARGALLSAAVDEAVSSLPRRPLSAAQVTEVDVDRDLLWETAEAPAEGGVPLYAWVAGEASVVRGLRRSLVQVHGVPRRHVAFMGYWREGRAEG